MINLTNLLRQTLEVPGACGCQRLETLLDVFSHKKYQYEMMRVYSHLPK
jgi:hypothetical protein